MIRSLPTDNVEYVLGTPEIDARPLPPYDDVVCTFLDQLAVRLRKSPAAKVFPDIMAFAFWCRRGNIRRLVKRFDDGCNRLGRGLAFHVTPSNVPVNFAFSLAFGMLAGNANVVRLSSRKTEQARVLCSEIGAVLATPDFRDLERMTAVVRYAPDTALTTTFSAVCDARVLWGGDEAIGAVRAIPLPARSIEVTFADRYSLCVLDGNAIEALDDAALTRLAQGFYNDTYLMDQNACSSPHLVAWLGGEDVAPRQRFWAALREVASGSYHLEATQAVDKYMTALQHAVRVDEVAHIFNDGMEVVRLSLNELPTRLETVRGRFGLFFEANLLNIDDLGPLVTNRFQTLTYFGLDRTELARFVVDNRLSGIDRIVPIGRALDIDIVWDGFEVDRHLSRVVDIQ